MPDEAIYCGICGEQLPPHVEELERLPPYVEEKVSRRNYVKYAGAVAVVAVVAAAGYGIYEATKPPPTTPTPTPTPTPIPTPIVTSTPTTPTPTGEALLFQDDFESYAVGSFPSAGGWELVFDGRGNQHQVIVDTTSYSGQRSLQLWGQAWWSAVAQRRFSSDANMIGYEQSIMISERNLNPQGTHFESTYFWNRNIGEWGRAWASLQFWHTDLSIRAENEVVLGTWTAGIWYRVRVVLDRQVNNYSVWINGELKGRDLALQNQDTNMIDAIALASAHPGVKVYHDDVSVFLIRKQTQ